MSEGNNLQYIIPSYVQKLFRIFERSEKKKNQSIEGTSTIIAGDTVSRVAFFYEKIRNAIDYKEEHLLRKSAVLRILSRRFIVGVDTTTIAEPLIKELILAGYLPNKTLPETKIKEVTDIINKYAQIINAIYHIHEKGDKKQIFNWLVKICSCEIEENLAYSETDRALIDFMFFTLEKRIVFKGGTVKEESKDLQIYIAILRTLVRYDVDMVGYNILKYYFNNWYNLSKIEIEYIALHIKKIIFKVEYQQTNGIADRVTKVVRKYIPIFSILKDLIHRDPHAVIDLIKNPEHLQEAVKKECESKYKEIKSKLKRTSLRSIIYIFLTKMVVALILEVPYEIYIAHEELNYIPLGINVFFHPLLLFLIALVIRVPSVENTKKIFEGIKNLVYDYSGKDIKHFVRKPQKRNFFMNFIFQIFYFFTYVITFGGIVYFLMYLNFNFVGIVLFLLFLSLVTFFGLRVRQNARELLVLEEQDGFTSLFINFFSIPIVRAGRWISVNFSKINFFVFFFDVIIEAPFKLVIDVFEDWSTYIKEKKEEIYDKE